jgi:hypothetical protein
MDANASVDASGSFPGGALTFNDPGEFRQGLLQHRELVLTTLTEKLLTYALGRGVEAFDMPAVRTILRNSEASDYRWSSLVLNVVKSLPFQMRTAGS